MLVVNNKIKCEEETESHVAVPGGTVPCVTVPGATEESHERHEDKTSVWRNTNQKPPRCEAETLIQTDGTNSTPSQSVYRYQRFEATFCLHL